MITYESLEKLGDDCNKLLNYISATTDIEKNRKMRKAQKSIIQSIKNYNSK